MNIPVDFGFSGQFALWLLPCPSVVGVSPLLIHIVWQWLSSSLVPRLPHSVPEKGGESLKNLTPWCSVHSLVCGSGSVLWCQQPWHIFFNDSYTRPWPPAVSHRPLTQIAHCKSTHCIQINAETCATYMYVKVMSRHWPRKCLWTSRHWSKSFEGKDRSTTCTCSFVAAHQFLHVSKIWILITYSKFL